MDYSHCPYCGAGLSSKKIDGRDRQYCGECDRVLWRNAKPAAGVAVVDQGEILLVKRGNPPDKGTWSLPAGYMEYEETPVEGAVRELFEETGIGLAVEDVEIFDTVFAEGMNGENVVIVVYRIESGGEPSAGDDALEARFWSLEELENSGEVIRPAYRDVIEKAVR